MKRPSMQIGLGIALGAGIGIAIDAAFGSGGTWRGNWHCNVKGKERLANEFIANGVENFSQAFTES
jgi:hypothetical protein